jgi:hypothetical protein
MASEEENGKFWAKVGLLCLKAGPSIASDVWLSEQEKLAQKEHRVNDLRLIQLGKSIKKDVDSALDEWIVNL